MIEVEIQKLTAAITALVEVLRSAKVGNELPTETPTISDHRQISTLFAICKFLTVANARVRPLMEKVQKWLLSFTTTILS